MSCTIVGIPKKPCNSPNNPGMKRLFAIPVDDIASKTVVDKAVSVYTFAATKSFVEINFTRYSGNFTGTLNAETIDSENIESSASCFVPQINPALHAAIDSFLGVDLVLVAVDGNGAAQEIGDADNPARLTAFEGGSGADEAGERNGYTLTFSKPRGRFTNNFYTGAIADLLVAGI